MDIRKALLLKSLGELLIISLPQSRQLAQARDIQQEEIRMSINLPDVKSTSEKLQRVLRSHKIRSTFYTENNFLKLLCRPKDRAATEDKNNIVYQIDCSNCEAVYFGESERSLKSRSDKHKRSVRNCDCDKNEIAKHCWEADHNFSWDQKKVVNRESRLIPRKIKETIHSLKNPNYINKISYMLAEIWLPNLLCHIRRFQLMTLTQTHHFCVREALLSNYFNLSNYNYLYEKCESITQTRKQKLLNLKRKMMTMLNRQRGW